MAHTLNVSSLVSKQLVQSLHAKGNFINTVNKAYSADFTQKKYTPGQTVTIEIAPQATITSGRVAVLQNMKPTTTSVTLGQYNGAFEMTSIQREYDFDSEAGVRRFGDTIALRLAREMEVTGFTAAATYVGNAVGTPGTEPGSLRTWADGNARLTNALAPMRERYAAVSPLGMVALTDSLKGAPNPADTIGNQYLTGRMKSAAGMSFYESPSIYRHTAGTADNSTPLVDDTVANGASTVHIDGVTSGETVTVGMRFTFDGIYDVDPETKQRLPYLKKFSVTAAATAAGVSDVDLAFSPPIYDSTDSRQNASALPANDVAIVFDTADAQTATCNLIYDKDAFSLVSVPLPKSMSKAVVHEYGDYDGIQMRVGIYPPDAINDTEILRIDACWGWATLRPEHACVVWGA